MCGSKQWELWFGWLVTACDRKQATDTQDNTKSSKGKVAGARARAEASKQTKPNGCLLVAVRYCCLGGSRLS